MVLRWDYLEALLLPNSLARNVQLRCEHIDAVDNRVTSQPKGDIT